MGFKWMSSKKCHQCATPVHKTLSLHFPTQLHIKKIHLILLYMIYLHSHIRAVCALHHLKVEDGRQQCLWCQCLGTYLSMDQINLCTAEQVLMEYYDTRQVLTSIRLARSATGTQKVCTVSGDNTAQLRDGVCVVRSLGVHK